MLGEPKYYLTLNRDELNKMKESKFIISEFVNGAVRDAVRE